MPYPIEQGDGRPRGGPLVPGFMRRLGTILETIPRPATGAGVALLLVIVTVLDIVTTPPVVIGVFYIIPIIIAACWLGPRAAVLSVVVAGIGVMLALSVGPGAEALSLGTRIWNTVAHTILFFIVAAIQSSLCAALAHERELARTDPLTGVANARYLMQLAHREQRRARRYRTPITVGYIGIEWNPEAAEGNRRRTGEMARDVAVALAQCVREIDVLARMAPGEFALLLPHADAQGGRIVFERVNDALEQLRARLPIRWSIGVVTFPAPPDQTEELVRAAERLMYSVRTAGGGLRFAAISPASVKAHSPFGA